MARQSVSPGADQQEDCASDGVPGGAVLRTPLATRLTTLLASALLADHAITVASRSRFGACLRSGRAGTLCPFLVELLGLQARDTRHFSTMLQPSPTSA